MLLLKGWMFRLCPAEGVGEGRDPDHAPASSLGIRLQKEERVYSHSHKDDMCGPGPDGSPFRKQPWNVSRLSVSNRPLSSCFLCTLCSEPAFVFQIIPLQSRNFCGRLVRWKSRRRTLRAFPQYYRLPQFKPSTFLIHVDPLPLGAPCLGTSTPALLPRGNPGEPRKQ